MQPRFTTHASPAASSTTTSSALRPEGNDKVTVRNHEGGAPVDTLGYSCHPTAEAEMRRIAEKLVADYPVRALAAVHRVGDLEVGDLAVVVAVSCPHRGEAFEACRRLIDDLKHEVPIWKHQKFSDGTEEWVGAC